MNDFDVIIIGGGPIGIACGIEAQKRDLCYLIIEKGTIVNSLFNYPEGMTFFSSSDKLELDDIPFISENAKPYKSESLEYYRRIVTSKNLNINLFETVIDVKKEVELYHVKTSRSSYNASKIVVATGFYDIPNKLNIPGEALPKVSHYYKHPHYYSRQRVAIVGASNSAVDAALEIFRKGGHVTMIIRGDKISERVKYWVRPDMINRLEEGNIQVYYNAQIEEISEGEIVVLQHEKEIRIKNDYVLALTGYQPNFDFLQKIGITLSSDGKKKPFYKPETMETDRAGIYLAGVICGGMETHKWFIENSRIHASLIMDSIKTNFKI